MDMSLITQAWGQLGAMGLLLLGGWWVIRTDRKRCAEERTQYIAELASERSRNQTLAERVIQIAESSARTGAEQAAASRELAAAVRAQRP